jgi:NADH dehydrogenase (ubiquinone) Fe-S protein 4
MSALSRSIASRLLPVTLRPTATRAAIPKHRTYSSESPTEPPPKTSESDEPAGVGAPFSGDSKQIREEGAGRGVAHKPDYNVAVDYRTSSVESTADGWQCTITDMMQ